MQSGKAQISMRDSLTFLDDGDEHVASSNRNGDRRPDHWDAEIVSAMVSTSATSDDDGSTSEQRWPRLDLVGDPLSRPRTTVEPLGHVDDSWNLPVNSWLQRGRRWRVPTTSTTTGTAQWPVDTDTDVAVRKMYLLTVDRRPAACVCSSGWSVLQATTDRQTLSDGQITERPCSLPTTPTENSVVYLETHWRTTSLFNNVQIASDFVNSRTKPTETLLISRGQKTVRHQVTVINWTDWKRSHDDSWYETHS